MFQADHHSPCVQERQGNLSKWLSPEHLQLDPDRIPTGDEGGQQHMHS
jgi:hypothetical protein